MWFLLQVIQITHMTFQICWSHLRIKRLLGYSFGLFDLPFSQITLTTSSSLLTFWGRSILLFFSGSLELFLLFTNSEYTQNIILFLLLDLSRIVYLCFYDGLQKSLHKLSTWIQFVWQLCFMLPMLGRIWKLLWRSSSQPGSTHSSSRLGS